jgi:heterodisulfide reductase subunit A-like polyferredoxin
VDEPINIRALKRFVTDKVYSQPPQPVEPAPLVSEKRVAVIGAGPCGLTAAQDVRRAGYGVTVFEAMPVAGGMLRLGVPEYRLPTGIIEREVQEIVDLGIDLRLNHRINNLDEVFQQGYEAVLIAVGAHEGVRLPIPGANLHGVLINTHFLRDVRLGKYASGSAEFGQNGLGKHVLVLGGGNVAIDCARSAVRLGCEVSMACVESREKMPAHQWEITAAEEEGVSIYPGRSFERVLDNGQGHVAGVETQQVASFSFDERGRLQLEKIPNTSHTIPCDTVIFSVGQRAGLAFIPDDANVGLTERQTIATNPNTLATSRPGVFAAGDCISGTAFVIEAVDRGHTAAQSILRYLRQEALEPPPKPELPVVKLTQGEIDARKARGEIRLQNRVPMPELPVSQRRDNFAEVEGGYDDESAQAEAARCLACGICSECMSCTFACGVHAIDHDMTAWNETVQVGAIILAPGYQVYHAELSEEYGFGRYPNVITSLQFERLLSASGPTLGRVQRPSDNRTPQRIAFLQCIGSRDRSHDYCSAICCMAATKEALIAKEHDPELDIHVFMMDMRAFSKGYWGYFERARDRYGIQYTRCRVSAIREDPVSHNLLLEYLDESGARQHAVFDLAVLSVGMEISENVRQLGQRLGIEMDEYGFCHTVQFNPVETSRPGIYAIGPFREPKDIPESVVEASGAAAAAAALISPARFSLTIQPKYPPERKVRGEPPRIGVFVCHCGSNIGGYLDAPAVTQYAAGLPGVAHAEANLYTCSQDSIRHISQVVAERQLNRVVVASCTPLTHAPLFQDSIRAAGLNPYLFEMANIRNQCSWVHSHEWDVATAKAKDLVRMAVARAALLEPQATFEVPVQQTALVVGGGAAGMTAALSLAEGGFPTVLVEKEAQLGGNLRRVYTPMPGLDGSEKEMPQAALSRLVARVTADPRITVHLQSRVVAMRGFRGNFTSTIQFADGRKREVAHGATILATGAREYRGGEYGYATHPKILTQQEFEAVLANESWLHSSLPDSVVMIQCVGPAEKFCSRICCTVALKNALWLKALKPDAQVVILYKDIRTYGFKERLYTAARQQGVLFLRYDDQHKPQVEADHQLVVSAWDAALGRSMRLQPDLVVLSMPVVPNSDVHDLAGLFKVPVDADGFFLEAHVKLRPVDFATDGIFMAGLAHYPKLLDEALIQAQAAAARAARLLSRETLTAGGRVAVVDADKCTACLTCVRICPFNVPVVRSDLVGVGNIPGAAYIEASVCQGCGSCAAECPARAIQLMHYTDLQLDAKVDALAKRVPVYIPIEAVL